MRSFFDFFIPHPDAAPPGEVAAEEWPPPNPPRRKAEAAAPIMVPVAPPPPAKPAGPVSYGMRIPTGTLRQNVAKTLRRTARG